MLDILYQDQDIIAINKPAGWMVHRSWLDRNEKVVVMQTLRDQIGQHVYPVHRLDRPTSGTLLLALSSAMARSLAQQFEHQQVKKTYHGIVRGYLTDSMTIDYPLVEEWDKIADKYSSQNKPVQSAISSYHGLKTIEIPVSVGRYPTSRFSLVELTPHTGRKHQLRRHMKHIFHPIIGDSKHGDLHQNRAFSKYFSIQRLMLHSSYLSFVHPATQEPMIIKAELDEKWKDILTHFN